jgi:hypothetical protein
MRSSVALRTLPPTMLMVRSYVAINIETLEMCTEFSSRWDFDGGICNWALKTDSELFSSFCFNFTDLFSVTISILFKKCDSSFQTYLRSLNSINLDKINYIVWLYYLDQKYSTNLAWVCKVPLMIPLLLHDLDPIFAPFNHGSYV